MVKITEIVESSIEWTATMLFRPFAPKKWFLLGFIALMAGQLASGGNFNSAYQGNHDAATSHPQKYHKISTTQTNARAHTYVNETQEPLTVLIHALKSPEGIAIIILVAMFLVLFFIIMTWLSARFNFVFLENVVKNTACVKMPFKNNRILGESLFKFSLLFGLVFIILLALIIFACFYALSTIGALRTSTSVGFVKIFMTCIPFVFIFFLLLLISALISFIINDFALIIMYKDKISVLAALKKSIALIRHNMLNTLKYMLMKIALFICVSLIYSVLTLVALFGILYPAIIAGLAGYAFSRVLPQALHFAYFMLGTIILICLLLFLMYCLMCLYLPFAVFFRTLSVKFMGRLQEQYNLFVYTKE
jgi:hypothetical protein